MWASAQVNLYDDTVDPPKRTMNTVSLRSLLGSSPSNSSSRVIGCTVIGVDIATWLPVTVSATSKIILNLAQSSFFATTRQPTSTPSRLPTLLPTPTPPPTNPPYLQPRYRYWKFEVLQTRVSTNTLTQISELYLYPPDARNDSDYYVASVMYPLPTASDPVGSYSKNEDPMSAFDDTCATKWASSRGAAQYWALIVDFKRTLPAGSFAFCTGNDFPDRGRYIDVVW